MSRLVSRHRFVHSIQFPRLSLSRSSTQINHVKRDASSSFLRRNLTTGKPEGETVAKEASKLTKNEGSSFLQRFLGPKEMPPRWTFTWYREMVLLCTVFAITGSSTMVLVSGRKFGLIFASECYTVRNDLIIFCSLGSTRRLGCSRIKRKHERWPVVVSDMFTRHHDPNLCFSFSCRGHDVWTPPLFPTFFCENVEPIRNSSRNARQNLS